MERAKEASRFALELDVFGQGLVQRDATAWYITDQGRAFLGQLEATPDTADVTEPVAIEASPAVEDTLKCFKRDLPSLCWTGRGGSAIAVAAVRANIRLSEVRAALLVLKH